MKQLILAAAIALSAQTSFADGTANLDLRHFNASYLVTLTGSELTGSQGNFGGGSGEVKMSKADGLWSGRFGFNQIETKAMRKRSDTRSQFEFRVLPGGNYSVNIEVKGEKTNIALTNGRGDISRATLKEGKYLRVSTDYLSVDLDRKSDTTWQGLATRNTWRGFESWDTYLDTTGDLNPETLAKSDMQLFIILYVLPYAYSN